MLRMCSVCTTLSQTVHSLKNFLEKNTPQFINFKKIQNKEIYWEEVNTALKEK